MKKILLLSFIILFFASTLVAQKSTAKLSPLSKKYLKEIKYLKGEQNQVRNYVYKKKGNTTYISALLKVNNTIDVSQLNALRIKIGTKAGSIWTAQIPIENVEAFIQVSGIDYIQLDEPAIPTLDFVRADTRVDSVHEGYDLPMPYNGEGVVVGVIDAGFDFGHPAYFDTTGTGYRVKKVWLQKNNSGSAPAGYAYGTELTDSSAMWGIGYDDDQTHGTHVSGICAGSGFGSPDNGRLFRGIAYKSDIVLVGITPDKNQWISTGVSDMIDGINYIFTYAASVNKPAVANLSWGSPLGPHDGAGLFSQALDNLTGPGKIFVCSAGNSGQDTIHVQKTFTPSDTLVQTFLDIAVSPEGKKTWVDMWGDTGKTFCVQVSLFNDSQIASTGFVCLDDSMHDLFLVGSNNDTCFVSIITSTSEFNMKPRIFLDFNSKLSNSDSICISVKGNDGTIDFWNSFVSNTSGYYGAFLGYGKSWAVDGDQEITISDIATSKSAITVGAYASKTNWTNISSQTYTYSGYVTQGDRVRFSSHGPTTDGRIKPDITAPGLTVGSSISSYDSSFISTGPGYLYVVNIYHDTNNNRDYPYGQLLGTSMSSPVVSGIAALMLQVKNDLGPQEIKDIINQTAITDNFTGVIPSGGNNTWGNGKVNAYGSVRRVVQIINSINNIPGGTLDCNLYPNPNEGLFTLDYSGDKNEILSIELFDMLGHSVFIENWKTVVGANFNRLNVKDLEAGIYFTKVSSYKGQRIFKVMITK